LIHHSTVQSRNSSTHHAGQLQKFSTFHSKALAFASMPGCHSLQDGFNLFLTAFDSVDRRLVIQSMAERLIHARDFRAKV
jgi:hypothetical protein